MDDTMRDEEIVSRMLASLNAVDAPDNFEGEVRSRIAQRRDGFASSGPTVWLVAKFALPMLLLLLVGGFLIILNEQELSRDLVPPMDNGTHDVAVIEESGSGDSRITSGSNVNTSAARAAVSRGQRTAPKLSQGGSEDIALSHDDSTVFPDGVDPRKATITKGNHPGGGSISPADVLSMIGISSNCSPVGCVANAVRQGSLAAAAGIQSGDVISAIDGRPINSSSGINGKFTVSELTLIRSGKKMTVSIASR